ncbi:MAG: carbon-nitrogen hydrolase family protein [Acutalibacter sp.]|nr:carbon-nitrogen hydrolase family protein [Acutalibacter sp.]
MKIGLAPYKFKNNDIAFNLSQIEKAMQSTQGKADLLCFGETFLQGFDALSWDFEKDKDIAVSVGSPIMLQLCELTLRYGVDLLLGYLERDGDSIYSSCVVLVQGKIAHNYRRISKGWKEPIADGHYREGNDTREFLYRGRQFQIALCGDLWDFPERFQTGHVLIWPIYVNFSWEDWAQYEQEYAAQAQLAARRTLLVNSISDDPIAHGGAFCFVDGCIEKRIDYDQEEILIVEV